MKKRIRNPEKFDVLELFASMAAEYGYDLRDPVAQNDFVERVKISIEKSKSNRITVFGKRVESLFAYVAGALGEDKLLKQEDSGDLYFAGDEVLAPDYRLTMHDGSQFFVEVKNSHLAQSEKPFSIKKDYYKKLQTYSELNGLELKFAIYFSVWNLWSLLSINSFEEQENDYVIDFPSAIAKSEMSVLGDRMVGTVPNLELHLLANPDEASIIDEYGEALFITRSVKIYCAGNEIVDEQEKRIAFYLMRFGDWKGSETEAIISKKNSQESNSFLRQSTKRNQTSQLSGA
ncbi:MAG: hypothetical protein HGB26_05620 [Desulfobulbaceae bacterium]|nr:hypothetical protein [Desulfobulbaceae bacterium]